MNRPAAKEKTRSSGPSRSYLKTRIRASRLYEAAFILAIVELSRTLHQAYEQAYGKQAAEWLLPQNPTIPKGTPDKYVNAFNKALEEIKKRLDKEKCAKFFGGKDKALATINVTEYRFLPLGGPTVDQNTGAVNVVGAQTNSATSVFVNTQGPFLNQNMFVPGAGLKTLDLHLRRADTRSETSCPDCVAVRTPQTLYRMPVLVFPTRRRFSEAS